MTDRARRPPKDNPDGPLVERQVGERLSEQAREIERLRGLLDGEGPQVSMGTAAGILQREVEAREKAECQLAEAERENGRLREVAHELVGFVRGGYGDSGEYAGTLRLIAEHAEAALNPPDPPASPAEGSEAATEVEGA